MTATAPRPQLLDDWDTTAGADGTARALPPVTVLLDPVDDAALTARLLDAHDPDAGRVTVHPTPSVTSPGVLTHDLLAALGHPIDRLAQEKISGGVPARQAVTAWLAAGDIEMLVVLRAHRLSPAGWERLLALWRHTGVALTPVCHQPVLDNGLAGLLHRITRSLADVLDRGGAGCPPPVLEEETGEDREELPPLPEDDVTGFRAEAWRRLSPAEFARIDAVYGRGLDAACRWLADQRQERSPLEFVPRHYLSSLFPTHLRPTEVGAGVALLEAHYPGHMLRSLAQGLLCVGGSPLRTSTKFPRRWEDGGALQRFLVELVSGSPSADTASPGCAAPRPGRCCTGCCWSCPATCSPRAARA